MLVLRLSTKTLTVENEDSNCGQEVFEMLDSIASL